jgi:hypothetical protein
MFTKNLKNELKSFKAIDLVVAVITGVVAWAYMLAGSPLINSVAQSMGPIGLLIGAFLLAILYILLTLGYPIRKSGLVILVAMLVQASMRLLTGDAFGFIALQAYAIGGPLIWFVTLMFKKYSNSFWNWLLIGALCHFLVDGIFYIYLGVAPLFGSVLLGYLWAYVGASIVTGTLIAIAQQQIYKGLERSRAIKQIWVRNREENTIGF